MFTNTGFPCIIGPEDTGGADPSTTRDVQRGGTRCESWARESQSSRHLERAGCIHTWLFKHRRQLRRPVYHHDNQSTATTTTYAPINALGERSTLASVSGYFEGPHERPLKAAEDGIILINVTLMRTWPPYGGHSNECYSYFCHGPRAEYHSPHDAVTER